jgi:FKBP-type peptidyl-prolyl cis-trans isomerase 2
MIAAHAGDAIFATPYDFLTARPFPELRGTLGTLVETAEARIPMRRSLILLALALGLLAAACGSSEGSSSTTTAVTDTTPAETATSTPIPTQTAPEEGFTVQDGDLIDVHYVGTLDDGSQFDSSRDRGVPFSFTVGTGQVIGGFDDAVRGGKVGDVNTVRIEPKDAYGEWSEDNVIEVPLNPEQDDVEVGETVYLTNGQEVVVLEVTADTVKLDANHSLAGQALTFEIEILSITRG